MLESVPEKQPAILSLVYVGGLALAVLALILSLVRRALMLHRKRAGVGALKGVAAADLSKDVRSRLGIVGTNRGLKVLRFVFVLMALAVFGFHVYWAEYAAESNEQFQSLNYKDLRNRRLAESRLRGWILDRSGQYDRALALYKRDNNGDINRVYPFDSQFAHLLGTERGDPGLERALFGVQNRNAMPEAWDVAMGHVQPEKEIKDVRLTIDSRLQQEAVNQLKGRYGAVVVLNPQTGEVLAMYSNPSYSISDANDQATWIRLNADKKDSPLVNRATSAYYIPGSTFKTVVMIAAFNAGLQGQQFAGTPGGFVAQPGAKPITDDNGSCEVCGMMGIDKAYEISSNQYFAQMGVKLGVQRLKETAQRLGIGTYDKPEEALRGRKEPQIIDASSPAVARALAPRESTIVTDPKIRPYDLALEGYGQGYAGQMTPLQMALAAAAVGNMSGQLMKVKFEMDVPSQVFSQVTTPQNAAQIRQIMGLVTMGDSGTARAVFAPVTAAGIKTGGKTGTAQKEVPLYDPKTGEVKTVKKEIRDPHGTVTNVVEQVVLAPEPRVDSWFLCIAPLEQPQLAIAVVIEGGGYGARAAAPVAAALVMKARDLGLLGGIPMNNNQPAPIRGMTNGTKRTIKKQDGH